MRMFTKHLSPLRRLGAGAIVVAGLAVGSIGFADAAGRQQLAPAEQPQQAQPAEQPQQSQPAQQTPSPDRDKILITMRGGTDDLHGSVMALKLAKALLDEGAEVTLFVNLEAVRLVDERQPDDLRWGSEVTTIGELYRTVVAAGGKVLVCPHCAKAAGLERDQLRTGAKIAKLEQVADAMIEADKVIDY